MLIVDGQIHLWEKGAPSPPHRQEPYSGEQAIAAMDHAGAGIVMEHVETAEFVDGRADRCLQACRGRSRRRGSQPPRFQRDERCRLDSEAGEETGDLRTFAGEQDCGSAADAITGASDENDLPASLGIDLSFSIANLKIA